MAPMSEITRSGFVAVVGRPNAGKSTFVNTAVGEKVAIVTPRPQTTRDRIRGIVSRPSGQIVLIDTPGIHEARGHKELNRRMVQAAMATLRSADCVLHLVDIDRALRGALKHARNGEPQVRVHPLDLEIRAGIRAAGRPTICLLNKVDRVRKPHLLPALAAHAADEGDVYRHIIPISAQDRGDVERVIDLAQQLLPEGPALYPDDQISDRSLRFTASEIIREKVFLETREELPYATAVRIESFTEKSKRVAIEATVLVERESQKGIVIGKGGSMLKTIGSAARAELQSLMGKRVHLDIIVRTETRWSDRKDALDALGYGADS